VAVEVQQVTGAPGLERAQLRLALVRRLGERSRRRKREER